MKMFLNHDIKYSYNTHIILKTIESTLLILILQGQDGSKKVT